MSVIEGAVESVGIGVALAERIPNPTGGVIGDLILRPCFEERGEEAAGFRDSFVRVWDAVGGW